MENVVTAVFEVESEAYQAFTEIRQNSDGKGYTVAEAALIKRALVRAKFVQARAAELLDISRTLM